MNKFTPGPWIKSKSSELGIHRYIDAKIDGGLFQEVCCVGPTDKPEQSIANAHLIAAAPDMYAALKGLLDILIAPNESAFENFERTAEAFYRNTGMLAPGKDSATGPSHEERANAFKSWRNQRILDGIAALLKAEGRA